MQYRQASDVLSRAVPGYLTLAKPDGTVIEVHGPGADVWQAIDQPVELDQLVDVLADRFATDRGTVFEDVRRLLVELEAGGYVTNDG